MTNLGADFEQETAIHRDSLELGSTTFRSQPVVHWTDSQGTHSRTVERTMIVGSGESVDVRVADPTVSRIHAELDLRPDGAWIKDLSSRNGTFVAGVRVSGAQLPEGPCLRIGGTTLRISYEQTPTPISLWPSNRFGPLLGQSVVMREFFARLARVAPTDSTVLIHGETGTGKELVAHALHDASTRKDQPFVIVDCGSLPENLLEAELFGHAKGAFTGAMTARAGAIESADGGTVFLDEIGELALSMQPKLLRVIESRTVRRLGETKPRNVNVRIISATHRDLGSMVNQGAFREDLYFRLAVLPISVPALRDRKEDIPQLVQKFLPPQGPDHVSAELIAQLMTKPWLGNVRELRNFVERAIALGTTEALAMTSGSAPSTPKLGQPHGMLPSPDIDRPFKSIRDEWLDHLEREYVRQILVAHGRKVTTAAAAAGLDPSYVHRLIKKHDL